MWKMNEVIRIEFVKNRIFHIWFDDGTEGDVDFSGYINKGPVFNKFRDDDFFKGAFIDAGTIAWPDGVDIAPETLYEKISSG